MLRLISHTVRVFSLLADAHHAASSGTAATLFPFVITHFIPSIYRALFLHNGMNTCSRKVHTTTEQKRETKIIHTAKIFSCQHISFTLSNFTLHDINESS